MKKFLALVLVVASVFAMAGCFFAPQVDPNEKSEGVMTYEEYAAAELQSEVVIEAFVQAKQSWWEDKASIYLQDGKGGYFAYNASCSKADYDKLEIGTKVKFTGTKIDWKGEIELKEGATFEIVGTDKWIAEPLDVTSLLGKDELISKQNMKVSFKNMKVEEKVDEAGNKCAFFYDYDNSGEAGGSSDLYFDVSSNGKTYTFVIEYYLCNENSDAYKAIQGIEVGDVIDMEGFLYWYEGVNPHITKVTVK